jgi:cell division protein YceG involved in septum cleavage
MSLASIVEREAMLDEGADHRGRLPEPAGRIPGVKNKILNSDPTVFYAIDTMALDKLKFEDWQHYKFWFPPGVPLAGVAVPEELQGYQTYTTPA